MFPVAGPGACSAGAVVTMQRLGEFNHSFKRLFLWKAGLARDESLPAALPSAFPFTPLEKYTWLIPSRGDRETLCEFP